MPKTLTNGGLPESGDRSVKITGEANPDLRTWFVRADAACNADGEYRWYEGGYRSGQRPMVCNDEPQRWDEIEDGRLTEVYGVLLDGPAELYGHTLAEVERINR